MTAERDALHVPPGVVAEVAAAAAREVPGVARLGRGGRGLAGLLARAPIEVQQGPEGLRLRVRIVALGDVALGGVAEGVRRSVAAAVQHELGLTVEEVTVVVAGLEG